MDPGLFVSARCMPHSRSVLVESGRDTTDRIFSDGRTVFWGRIIYPALDTHAIRSSKKRYEELREVLREGDG